LSDVSWFGIFALILLLMLAVTGWMMWFSRRAMRSHKSQIEDMIREMRESVDEQRDGDGKRDSSQSG
jgi:uncharacterized iron-regulated membrane protein